jgi:hypothetical protein
MVSDGAPVRQDTRRYEIIKRGGLVTSHCTLLPLLPVSFDSKSEGESGACRITSAPIQLTGASLLSPGPEGS